MGLLGGTEILILIILYFLPIIFIIWMIVRFVKAHERIADGIQDLKHSLKDIKRNQNERK